MDGPSSASLLSNHVHLDWRPQISCIDLPTLVVAGQASLVPSAAARWVADTIPGARLEILRADEGGSHHLALENPDKFNRILLDFVA
jgi:pimeloyl-ACP methyl ester carboxylesterase